MCSHEINCTADHYLCFRYKFQDSSFLLVLYRPVYVGNPDGTLMLTAADNLP